MSKTNRIYKIFMATMIVAIAGMLLAMGIIAAQKTMKLGVQFSSNPNYKLEVFINDEETLIFRNFADNETGKTVKMDNGITSLNGDTLVADEEAFKGYGNDFTIIIKNYTESTGIEVAMESTAKIDGGADGIPAQIKAIKDKAIKYDPDTKIADSVSFRIYINSVFPQTTTLKMTISELADVSITYVATNNCFLSASPEKVAIGSTYETTITADVNNGYILDSVTVDGLDSSEYTITKTTTQEWTLSVPSVSKGFSISASARYPRLTISYGGAGDVHPEYGFTIDLIINSEYSLGQYHPSGFSNHYNYTPHPSNSYAEVMPNIEINLNSGCYDWNDSDGDSWIAYTAYFRLDCTSKTPSNLEIEYYYDNNALKFYMPASDVTLEITTSLGECSSGGF